MWRNPSNNYEEYFREHRELESEQWRSQTPMESFNQTPHEDQSFCTWTDFESFANEAFCQSPSYSEEDEIPEDPEIINMLLGVLEDRKRGHKKMDADMTLEAVFVEVFPTDYEIVVENQDDQIHTRQQSPAGEEVVETIQLHEDALNKYALALIVLVMNEETLRFNRASIEYETNKEEEEMVQIFELPQKELHQDEVVEPRVPGSPTPRIQHPQGLRKRLEWRIKHKWKIKLHNV